MTEIHTKYIYLFDMMRLVRETCFYANGLYCTFQIRFVDGTDEGDVGNIEHCNEIVILLYKM